MSKFWVFRCPGLSSVPWTVELDVVKVPEEAVGRQTDFGESRLATRSAALPSTCRVMARIENDWAVRYFSASCAFRELRRIPRQQQQVGYSAAAIRVAKSRFHHRQTRPDCTWGAWGREPASPSGSYYCQRTFGTSGSCFPQWSIPSRSCSSLSPKRLRRLAWRRLPSKPDTAVLRGRC